MTELKITWVGWRNLMKWMFAIERGVFATFLPKGEC